MTVVAGCDARKQRPAPHLCSPSKNSFEASHGISVPASEVTVNVSAADPWCKAIHGGRFRAALIQPAS